MKRQTLILSLTSILLLSLVLFAQPGRGPGGGQGAPGGRWMERALDLSAEQESKIEDLRLQHQKQMLPMRSKLESLQTDLHLAMTADTFDKGKAEKIVNDMQKVRTEMQMSRVLHQQAVRSLLTPEQRKKFDLHILSRKGPRDGRGFGQGDGRGFGPGYGRGPGGPAWDEPAPDEN